jgi:acetyl esterase/lipase
MRNLSIAIAILGLTACHAGQSPGEDPPDAAGVPDAAATWIRDPGLEGEPFRLDDPGCVETADRITCLSLPYSVVGDTTLHLDLFAPLAARTSRVPTLRDVHGGGWSLGSAAAISPDDVNRYLARGYAVVSIDYRLTLEHGQVSGVVFPMDLQDVKTAVRWLRAKAGGFVDGDRIVAYGFSAGAHLVAMLGATASVAAFEGRGDPAIASTVAGVVGLSTPIDFHLFVPTNPALDDSCAPQPPGQDPQQAISWLMGIDVAELANPVNDAMLTSLSPITYLDATSPPMVVFAGTCDQTVPYLGAVDLQALGLPQIEVFISEGARHGGTLAVPEARPTLDAFLAARLGAP